MISYHKPCLVLIIFFISQLHSNLTSQIDESGFLDPKFEKFEGTVYDMPVFKHKLGKIIRNGIQEFYSDTIYSYDTIQSISLNEINIQSTSIDEGGFPGIEKRTQFAMVLFSKMSIEKNGCYEFTLSSDDGSRLWINEEQIISNDGGHGMKSKLDTIQLNSGVYDIKLWYFQGMPDKLGFIFKSNYLPTNADCELIQKDNVSVDQRITISKNTINSVLFETDKYILTDIGKNEIQKTADYINTLVVNKISVIGHTDSIGSSEYNLSLSKKRAEHVMSVLQKYVTKKSIKYITIGKGATVPLDLSGTTEGREINRRVELVIE